MSAATREELRALLHDAIDFARCKLHGHLHEKPDVPPPVLLLDFQLPGGMRTVFKEILRGLPKGADNRADYLKHLGRLSTNVAALLRARIVCAAFGSASYILMSRVGGKIPEGDFSKIPGSRLCYHTLARSREGVAIFSQSEIVTCENLPVDIGEPELFEDGHFVLRPVESFFQGVEEVERADS